MTNDNENSLPQVQILPPQPIFLRENQKTTKQAIEKQLPRPSLVVHNNENENKAAETRFPKKLLNNRNGKCLATIYKFATGYTVSWRPVVEGKMDKKAGN